MFRTSLQFKMSAVIAAVVMLCVLVAGSLIAARKAEMLREHAYETLQQRETEMVRLLETTDAIMSERVQGAMRLMRSSAESPGTASLGEPVWLGGEPLPDLLLGGQSQVQQFALVDEVARIAGGTATLFVRKGNDFVRVATNVRVDGQRAVGTRLDPAGRAIEALRGGQAFYGQVDILGKPFLAGYEPVRDAAGQVIGALYVGFETDLAVLKNALENTPMEAGGVIALVDDRQRVRMTGLGNDPQQVERLLKGERAGWQVLSVTFPQWNYTVIAGFPEDALNAAVREEIAYTVLVALLLALMLVILISYLTRRLVSRPLAYAVDCAEHIVAGRLDHDIRADSDDEVGRLLKALGHMQQSLRGFMQEVARASNQVADAARELSGVTAETHRCVDDQRDRTDQVATAMTQMSATVAEVASNAVLAAEATQSAEQEADRVKARVDATVQSIQSLAGEINQAADVMRMLEQDSDRIGSVLDVIRNIAGQTNLLALNAAIEAARAGEQGRGFAVVADEVRTLASRTQQSTEEIQTMIQRLQNGTQNAVARVESGHVMARQSVEQVNTMSQSLQAITAAVERISLMNTQVASAAEEQSVVAEDVNRNILHITDVAEVTSSNAQRTLVAAGQLGTLAEELRRNIHRYQL